MLFTPLELGLLRPPVVAPYFLNSVRVTMPPPRLTPKAEGKKRDESFNGEPVQFRPNVRHFGMVLFV